MGIPATAVPTGAEQLTIFARTMSGTPPNGRSVPLQDLIGGPSDGDGLVDPAIAEPSKVEIHMSLVVEGLSYPLLASNPALLSQFKIIVKEAIVSEVGQGLRTEDVAVETAAGSVLVQATIDVPPNQ